jgi:hypothetical protein
MEEARFADGATRWKAQLKTEAGDDLEVTLDAGELVKVMAACNASWVHFSGGRCRVEGGRMTAVAPKTPHPLM